MSEDDGGWPIVDHILSSDKKTKYAIRQSPEGVLMCECQGWRYRQKCRHIKEYREGQEVTLTFRITFKDKTTNVVVVQGLVRQLEDFRIGDVTDQVEKVEQYLSRLTGLQVIIEQVE